tara:strand:- start:9902 stop:10036 length:135 start_codon:yes stop_codon:yes gene_type:complete
MNNLLTLNLEHSVLIFGLGILTGIIIYKSLKILHNYLKKNLDNL